MNHFPVSNSNLSATHLGSFLQEKYHLSGNTHCHLIKAGINDTYLVNDGPDKYVFRVYSLHWRTKTEILEEIRLLQLLQAKQLPVSYPIGDANKNYIQVLNAPEGDRFGVLFSHANGEKLHSYSTAMHHKIGVLMAQLHQLTQNVPLDRVTYTPEVLLEDSLAQIKKFLPAHTAEMAFMESAKKYLSTALTNVHTAALRQGAVHLDIWFDNLNISQAQEVTLFDFDFCGNGWLCLDLAYYILQLHNVERDENECKLKVDNFLQGYESVTPVSAEEKRLIPMLGVSIYFFYLGVQCRRYHNWSNSFLSESYLKRFINMLVKKYYDMYQLGDDITVPV